MSLAAKALSGYKWTALSQFVKQGSQFLTTLLLARLLEPSDFGIIGMAVVVTGFLSIFKDLGTSAAIIQKKELTEELLGSLYWINVLIGFIASIFLFICAPLAADIYRDARITPILRTLAPLFVISSIASVPQAIMERELKFEKLMLIEVSSVFIGALAAILAAISGLGVWSLVYQSLAVALATSILLAMFCQWKPKFTFNLSAIKQVSRFSLNLTGFNIFNYFVRNADYMIIGRYLGALELGYYTLAYRIMLFPLQNISYVVNRVMYPVFSSIHNDDGRSGNIYLKTTSAIAFVSFPLMTMLFSVAHEFVLLLFGIKWQPITYLLLILAPIGMLQTIGSTVGTIYQSKGRTDLLFKWGIVSGILIVTSFILGLRWGTIGIAASYFIVTLLLAYPSMYIPLKLINLPFGELVRTLRFHFINCFIMIAILLTLRIYLSEVRYDYKIIVMSTIGVVVFLLSNMLFNRGQLSEFKNLFGVRK